MIVRPQLASRIAALLLALLLALPGAARAEGGSPKLFSDPDKLTVKAGNVLKFSGSNFTPDKLVSIWATDPDKVAIKGDYPRAAGEDDDKNNIQKGDIAGEFQVPANATAGRWVLTAKDQKSDTTVTLSFTVKNTNQSSANKMLKVEPDSGTPDEKFTFTALGFNDNEMVIYWFTVPSDRPEGLTTSPIEAQANDNGRVKIEDWQPPDGAAPGTWVFTVQAKNKDNNKKRTLAIPFEIKAK